MANKYSRLYDKACGQFDTNFREVFDYLSDEYNLKNDDYRIDKLLAVVKERYSLHALIEGYKYHYSKNVKAPYVIEEIAPSCILILKHAAFLLADDPITKQEIGELESAMVFNRIDEKTLFKKLTKMIRTIDKLAPLKITAQTKKKSPVKSSGSNDRI